MTIGTPTLPTNFNDTDLLIEYGKDLGITVAIAFIVPAVVFSFILIIVFIKYCGGSGETRDKFTNQARAILISISVLIVAFSLACSAIGWTYNSQCHTGVQHGSTTLQSVIFSSADVMTSVNSTVVDLKLQLLDQVNQTFTIVSNISTLLVPLEGIVGVVGEVENTIQNLTALTIVIANNITAVKTDLANLQQIQTEGIITGVPSTNDIPNIDDQFTEALNSSLNNLDSVESVVNGLTDSVNNTLDTVAYTITDQLMVQTNEYSAEADEALDYFMDFYVQITYTNDSYNKYSSDVIHYSSIRKSVVAAILVLPIILTALSLLGIALRMKLLIKTAAAFCFIFMFWYFLLAGVNYIGYYTLHQFCQNQDEIVGNAISITQQEITVPGTNITLRVSEKVILLLKCSGNTTLIDIFEFNFLVDNLNDTIKTQLELLDEQIQQLNQTEEYQQGLNDLLNMENNSVNLDFLQNSSLPSVHESLRNITTELNDTINSPAYFSSIAAVNNITNNLVLTNTSTIHMYYDSSNITELNCTTDPYDKLSQSASADLCAKAATAIALTIARDNAIPKAEAVYGNITDINERLYGFESALPTIAFYQNQTYVWADEIRYYLNDAYNRAMGLIAEVQQMAQMIAALIYEGTSDIVATTQCAYVGDAYSSLSNTVCTDVKGSFEAISAVLVAGGCLLFISTITGMVTAYKIEKDLDYDSSS